MSYVTDVLRDLAKNLKISSAQYNDIHISANSNINSGDSEWLKKFFTDIGSAIGETKEGVNEIFAQRYQFVETMLLVQLGRPENILIINGNPSEYEFTDEY